MSLAQSWSERLSLPLIAAPMFLVSGVDLVVSACAEGVVGAFPTVNCRSAEELDAWLHDIRARLQAHEQALGRRCAPVCPNLIVHRSNPRLRDDLAVLIRHRVEWVIASVGSPGAVVGPLHDIDCQVFADVATVRHAHKAVAAGVDGLVLLCAGAGGQTGWANPFAFVRAVREFWSGPLVLAGGIADGRALWAAQVLGCDLAYMGTRFIATAQSQAQPNYKAMLVASGLDDVLLTRAFTGLETNMLRPSILAAGLDPDHLPVHAGIDIAKDIDLGAHERKRWKDIWSAGHSVSGVHDVPEVGALVARLRSEYQQARQGL